jgi:DNA-binding PadR family transcriptional regulator
VQAQVAELMPAGRVGGGTGALLRRKATFYILLSLAPEKKHGGYAILKDVEALSNRKVRLSTSTLYGALSRLLDQGLIERVPNDEEENTGPGLPRKAYVLSKTGRRVLEAELSRMRALVAAARLRLGEERT